MARPVSITAEHVLEAARAVFMERGYDATTAQIAKRAGVSEGSLFKRYKGKGELFLAAMEFPAPRFLRIIDEVPGKGDVKQNLVRLATLMLEFFEELLPKAIMTWSNPNRRRPNRAALRGMQRVRAFFAREMELGRLRKGNPEVVARIFAGSLWHFCFTCLVFGDRPSLKRERFSRELVDHLWDGLKP